MRERSALEALGRRIFVVVLRLLPAGMREGSGGEMVATFAARQRDARREGVSTLLAFQVREVGGLLSAAIRARLGRRRRSPSPPPGASPVSTLVQDLRHVLRSLYRSPAWAATAVGVVAVALAAATAIFSAADAVLFRPLPFRDPDRLVMLWEHNPLKDWEQVEAAPANALDWRERVDAFQDLALYSRYTSDATYVGTGGAERIHYTEVTGNLFDVLGVEPALGRGFTWEETWAGGVRPVILSHRLWRDRFGADPGVVGRVVDFAGLEAAVVGVMPEGFLFPTEETRMWSPFGWEREYRQADWFRRAHWLSPVARLRPGATVEEARTQLDNVAARLERENPEINEAMGAGLTPLHEFLSAERRAPLLVMLGAVGLLLLIACANVGNLILVRSATRERELAVRRAMGAGGGRLARLVLLEAGALAAAGGALGFGLGVWGVGLLERVRPMGLAGVSSISVDGRVALFGFAAVAACALLSGVPTALRAGRTHPSDVLREGGRGGSAGSGALRGTRALVVAEVALSLVLVMGAGLLVRSFLQLRSVDPGVRTENVMTFRLGLPGTRYGDRASVVAFWEALLDRLEALPDVESAGLVRGVSPVESGYTSDFSMAEWPPERAGYEVLHREASPGYFATVDVPLLAGRLFDRSAATDDGQWVVVVNRAFVDEHLPGEEVVGRRIAFDRVPDEGSRWRTVVGVVGSERQDGLASPPRPEVFAPVFQDWNRNARVVLRTRGEPRSVMPAVRALVAEMDPVLPVVDERSMDEVMARALAEDRFTLLLIAVFAAAALVLAAVGIYGVTAQATRRRTREIGIRMALGAEPRGVRGMVVRDGMTLVGGGLALGMVASLAGAGLLRSLLYQTAPTDPLTLTAVPALLAGVALVACWLPARRATRVDPVASLRAE